MDLLKGGSGKVKCKREWWAMVCFPYPVQIVRIPDVCATHKFGDALPCYAHERFMQLQLVPNAATQT